MGDILKKQYEERDLAKALAKVHGIIDGETKKLSDKVKNLTLSHKRMRKLLKMCLIHVDSLFSGSFITWDELHFLHKRLTLELYGLEGYKEPSNPVCVVVKKKGGKRCV